MPTNLERVCDPPVPQESVHGLDHGLCVGLPFLDRSNPSLPILRNLMHLANLVFCQRPSVSPLTRTGVCSSVAPRVNLTRPGVFA